jgi:outer membrane protein assembly factor BamB
MHARRLWPSVLAIVLSCALLHAAAPQFWRLEGARAFLDGELEGVRVDSEGRIRLGASPRPLFDPEAPDAWCVARDAKGALYVGTGNEGRVVRIEAARGSVLFDAEELGVHAIAVGPDGRVYAATSPDGAVYAIDAGGAAKRFFDPAEKYIWALAFDAKGALYVATGVEGRIYRVQPDGRSETVLASSETHILSLAVARDGRVYAGSAPEGLVYRLAPGGRPFVVYDSPFREIKALDVGDDGSLYAAAIDGRAPETTPRPTQPAPPSTTTTQPGAEVTVTESFTVAAAPQAASVFPGAAGGEPQAPPKGALLRIRPSGDVDTLWSSPDDVPHSAAWTAEGVLVGTGSHGKVYRVTANDRWELVATLPAEQVTGIARTANGSAALVTANPARVLSLEGAPAAHGSFVSSVKDAESLASWGRLSWEGETPAGTAVKLETRLGNTATPDATWTDWTPTPASGLAPAEKARFLQLRLSLAGDGGKTPTVDAVTAAYLQRNLPPTLKPITLHPPGEAYQKPISASGEPEILGLDVDPLSERAAAARPPAGMPPAISFSRKLYQHGLRTFSWQADDPNGDALLFDVAYRALGDEAWRPLRSGLSEPVFAWDTATVPSGRYQVRITASDAPANPRTLALATSRETPSFEVDNAPPRITATLDPKTPGLIRVSVHDDSTAVKRLELSIDAGPWEDVHPEDGIADGQDETFRIELPARTGRAPRVAVLRASDRLGNVSTARVDVP